MTPAFRIEKLTRHHAVAEFDCWEPDLNRFLIRHALQAQQANSSTTYLGLHDDTVVGYFTIVVGSVEHAQAPDRVVRGMPRFPIPLLILARLAVHRQWHGKRLGAGLLLDALGRTLQVADIAAARALAVHAKDDKAASFYRHFGFIPSPTDLVHFYMLIKDVRAAAAL